MTDRTCRDRWGLFDACTTLGPALKQPGGWPNTAAELLESMDRHGVAEALVVDCLSRENHPADGNERVLAVTRNHPRLHPAWSALPAGGVNEQMPPDEFVEAMRRHGVGAVYLYPNQYRFGLSDWCVDAFLGPLADAGVPVFLNPNATDGFGGWDSTDLDAVVALCRRMPDLPVIISENRFRRSNRALYRAMDACDNLRVETGGYWLHRGIEYITRHWGARRLIFGSNWPNYGQHAPVFTLAMAEISDDDRRRIAGGNLRELMRWSGIEHPAVAFPEADDALVHLGRTGEAPHGFAVHDCHGHLGRMCHYHLPDSSIDDMVREMDRLSVRKVVVFGFSGIAGGDEGYGNDTVADALRRYPDRFLGLTLVNVNRGRDAMMRELERGEKLGMRGVKMIAHYQGQPDDHPLVEVATRWANDRRQIVLNHSWGSLEHLERMLQACPDACLLTGHTRTDVGDLMRRYPNLYVCGMPLHQPRDTEDAVALLGADRLLFGSDLTDLPIAWVMGPVLFARIPEADKRLILGGNLLRILERYSVG